MDYSIASKYMKAALNARAIRQDMIAGNLANVDTPYYKARDISFEKVLNEAAQKEFVKPPVKELELAKTQGYHLDSLTDNDDSKPTFFLRDGHMVRNDGNTVDIDVETTEMAKNSTMYNALISAIKKDSAIFNAVIDASKSTQ